MFQLLLQICDDVTKFEWHPNEEGVLIGGCMNGQILIWDITEYIPKLATKISIWDHEVVMEKQTDKLHIMDGFIPVLHWSAESNLKASHKAHVKDLHWLPSNVWVSHDYTSPPKSENSCTLVCFSNCKSGKFNCFFTSKYSSAMKVRIQSKIPTLKCDNLLHALQKVTF